MVRGDGRGTERPQSHRKPNSVPFEAPPRGGAPQGDDHSSSPAISDRVKRPTRRRLPRQAPATCRSPAKAVERATLERPPIWSCSVRGFACHRPCGRRGALLPHLFTLTRLRPPIFERVASGFGAAGCESEEPARRNPRLEEPRAEAGGMFSVPLSFGLPRPGITRRTALRSSDFPPATARERDSRRSSGVAAAYLFYRSREAGHLRLWPRSAAGRQPHASSRQSLV